MTDFEGWDMIKNGRISNSLPAPSHEAEFGHENTHGDYSDAS